MAEETNNKPAQRPERIGKYQIIGHIATGGMGRIYKARDVDLDRVVALKILPAELAAQEMTLERFRREAKAAARLRHENIVAIFDVGEADGTYFIALEYIEGTDLQDYITRKRRLDPNEAGQILIQATKALIHAHEHGIVHRDIKPSNFLLKQQGPHLLVKLTDFGLAIRHENDAEFRITRDKTTVGTVDYMSPEQARDSRAADIRSDIYSLGCTFYHMLAGVAPFGKGTLPERIIQHMRTPPPDVRKLNKAVPESFVTILNRMLAKKPDDRYQNPADLLHDLENPDEVAAPPKRAPVPAKLERGPAPKKPVEPTQVIDTTGMNDERDEPRPAKVSKTKKPAPEPDDKIKEVKGPAAEWQPPKKKSAKNSPVPRMVIVGSAGALALLLILTLIFGGKSPPVKKEVEKPPDVPVTMEREKPDLKLEKPFVDTSPAKMTVVALELPNMDAHPDRVDQAALRKEFYGPFTAFPEAPKDAPVLRVSRLAATSPNTFRTLGEALTQTKRDAFTVIEIHDDGPIYASTLPELSQRSILLRGAPGYRPLLVWETPKKLSEAKPVTIFCSLAQGKLIVDNLDFVMTWSDKAEAVLFDLPGTDFHARDCTFSIGGKSPQGAGVALVRRTRAKEADGTKTWFQRCYVRGADVSLVRSQQSSGAILVEESLIVGHQQPLIDLRGGDQDSLDLYCVRSTLVTGQIFLRWQSPGNKGVSPLIAGKVLDSILSRDDTTAPQGDMIQLGDGAEPSKMSWNAANAVYAGWKQLLASDTKQIAGTELGIWHDQWSYREGDRAILGTWPPNPPSGLEDHPASTFLPLQGPVAYSALTGQGSIGCVIGWLPPAPEAWFERTFEPRAVPTIARPDWKFNPPQIDTANDDLYHGERIDLTKVPDLGKYLTDKLQRVKSAPRVVIQVFGKGPFQTSSLRVKGIEHLVLYAKDPVLFEPSTAGINRSALVEMTGGHLEMIGVSVRLGAATLVPAIIQVREGDLTLTNCLLQGPHSKLLDGFTSLIIASNTNSVPTTLLLRDNILIAGKNLLKLQDHVQLRASNNVFLSFGDAVQFEANRPSTPLLHVLDHNTWGARHTFFSIRSGPEFQVAGPTLVHANSNSFLHPFVEDAEKATLLRGAEPWASHGGWRWQGRYNVYDTRMHAYFAGYEKGAGPKQTRQDWQAIWGQAGEQDSLLLAGPAATKTIMADGVNPAALLLQLDRLALPSDLRGDLNQHPPGADLVGLGLKKK